MKLQDRHKDRLRFLLSHGRCGAGTQQELIDVGQCPVKRAKSRTEPLGAAAGSLQSGAASVLGW